jgi:vacuolar protein sorting-associated protein 35
VFPDEYHLRSLEPFLSATAQLHPKLNVKSIIIALIDRLAAFAAREAETDSEDQTRSRLLALTAKEKEKRKIKEESNTENDDDEEEAVENEEKTEENAEEEDDNAAASNGEEKTADADVDDEFNPDGSVKKYRGIPEDVELFVVFWTQIVELVKQRPDLTVQDLTALLVSLTNLSLSCYPEKINYVDQVLTYAKDKVIEFSDTPDLHSKITESNLLALLLAPINSYPTVLTLLLLDSYQPLLALQTYSTRKAVAQAIISSVLRNETIISEPEDVNGVLEMCDVLIRDQKDAPVITTAQSPAYGNNLNRARRARRGARMASKNDSSASFR